MVSFAVSFDRTFLRFDRQHFRDLVMAKDEDDFSVSGLAVQRLNDLLEPLLEQGMTQTQIAAKAGLPPQYISDIKRGRRPMTELVARRLGEEFHVNFQWLMGTSSSMEFSSPSTSAQAASPTAWLPLFPHPIEGEPRQHPQWSGAGVELAGVAAGRIGLAHFPYVLQFGRDDQQGRLRRNDLILISQAPQADAEIHVVRYRKKLFLARAHPEGGFQRVADEDRLPKNCPILGHCVGVVWSALS